MSYYEEKYDEDFDAFDEESGKETKPLSKRELMYMVTVLFIIGFIVMLVFEVMKPGSILGFFFAFACLIGLIISLMAGEAIEDHYSIFYYLGVTYPVCQKGQCLLRSDVRITYVIIKFPIYDPDVLKLGFQHSPGG